jgi:hypothetical protein
VVYTFHREGDPDNPMRVISEYADELGVSWSVVEPPTEGG